MMIGTSVAQANSRQRRGPSARSAPSEGFQPAQFTSSRDVRAKRAAQRPEDFMDEGDFNAFGATLTAADSYGGARGSAVIAHGSVALARATTQRQGGAGSVSRAIAFSPEVISAVSAPQLSVGEELLRAMRWRPRKRDAAVLARQAAEVGLTAASLLPKLDSGGIGYVSGTGDAWLTDRAAARRSALVRHVTATGSQPAAVPTQGASALFTTDAYGEGTDTDMAQYDIAGTVEEERQLRARAVADAAAAASVREVPPPVHALQDAGTAPTSRSTSLVPHALPNRQVCHDGAPALPGFVISMTPLHQASQPSGAVPFLGPADVPRAFRAVHTFHHPPPAPPGASAAPQARRHAPSLTPAQRGAALGEAPPPAPVTKPSNTASHSNNLDSNMPSSAALRSLFTPASVKAPASAAAPPHAPASIPGQLAAGAAPGQGEQATTAREFNEGGFPVVPSVLFAPVFRVSEWAPNKLVCRRHNVPEPYTTQVSQGTDAARQQAHQRQSEATAGAAALLESLAASTAGQAAAASADAEAAPLPPQAPRDLLASVFQSDTEPSSEEESDSDTGGGKATLARSGHSSDMHSRPPSGVGAPPPNSAAGRQPLLSRLDIEQSHSAAASMPAPAAEHSGSGAAPSGYPSSTTGGHTSAAAAAAGVHAPAPQDPALAVGPELPPGFRRPAASSSSRRHRSRSPSGGGDSRHRHRRRSGDKQPSRQRSRHSSDERKSRHWGDVR